MVSPAQPIENRNNQHINNAGSTLATRQMKASVNLTKPHSGNTCGTLLSQCYIALDKQGPFYPIQSREIHAVTPPRHIGQQKYKIMQNSTRVSFCEETQFGSTNKLFMKRKMKSNVHKTTCQRNWIQKERRNNASICNRIQKSVGTHWRCSGETSHTPEHVESDRIVVRSAHSKTLARTPSAPLRFGMTIFDSIKSLEIQRNQSPTS